MGGPRTPRCSKSEHDWKPVRGGASERCTKCRDVFPCRFDCDHLDCIVATGRPVPDYYANPEQARENMLAELAETSPTVFAAIQKRECKLKRKLA